MGASCGHYIDGGSVSEGDYDRVGLELYHAYSVLDVRQLGENRSVGGALDPRLMSGRSYISYNRR